MTRTTTDEFPHLTAIDPVPDDRFVNLHATTEADRVFRQILASDVPSLASSATERRQFRRWPALVAAAAVLVGVLLAPQFRQQADQASAIEFTQQGDFIEAIIVDPKATKQELEQAFAEHGFDIDVQLLPTSPSLAGKVLRTMEDPDAQQHPIRTIHRTGACYTDGGGFRCPVGVKIPLDFEGHAIIGIGRLAADGERYTGGNTNPFYPAEMLHCSDLPGKTVAEALPILKDLGVTALWRSSDRAIDDVDGIDPHLIEDRFVDADGATIANDMTYIWVSSENNYPNGEDCNSYG